MTAQTRFTPGPYSILGKSSEWRAEPKRAGINATFSQMSIIAPDGRELALVVEVGDLEQKWDAHLIASAPDLYAALEALVRDYDHRREQQGCHLGRSTEAIVATARSALRRARGEA